MRVRLQCKPKPNNILRLTDEKNDFVCVLLEKDLSLLVADNGLFAASEWMDKKNDSISVAEYLGTNTTGKADREGGTHDRYGNTIEWDADFELADGRWITLAYTKNTLHGIQVHEDKASMEEMVCFVADITMNPAIVHLVSAECFVRGDLNDIAEGDMTPAEVEQMYSRFLTAALGQHFDPNDPTKDIGYKLSPGQLVYYRDESAYRCPILEGKTGYRDLCGVRRIEDHGVWMDPTVCGEGSGGGCW